MDATVKPWHDEGVRRQRNPKGRMALHWRGALREKHMILPLHLVMPVLDTGIHA
jgi:hypothetical protein